MDDRHFGYKHKFLKKPTLITSYLRLTTLAKVIPVGCNTLLKLVFRDWRLPKLILTRGFAKTIGAHL
jgi:hypothetical protein